MAYEPPTLQSTAVAVRHAIAAHELNKAFRLVAWFCDDVRRVHRGVVADSVVAEPESVGEHRWDAMLAGVAEYVCNRAGTAVPGWARQPQRFLDRSWFVIEDLIGPRSAAFREWMVEEAPGELASHGVYIDAASLESVLIERVQQPHTGSLDVLDVAGHEDHVVHDRGGRDEGVDDR